jgi:hypothetical protein
MKLTPEVVNTNNANDKKKRIRQPPKGGSFQNMSDTKQSRNTVLEETIQAEGISPK